jgi:nucleotidyltransferase substrate binding protein (TIGR01987 family)
MKEIEEIIRRKTIILQHALKAFLMALESPHNELQRDASIQRFEFCYELSWKLMKLILEYETGEDVSSPKAILKHAQLSKLIKDELFWLDIHRYRNETSHTYDESLSIFLYDLLPSYYQTMQEFLEVVLNRYQAIK